MTEFKSVSFRFQALQVYGVPWEQGPFREFMRSGIRHVDPGDPRLARLKERLEGGRRVERVQVVRPPVSDYLRFAFTFFHHSALVGEDLRILDSSRVDTADLPDYDFVLLDGNAVIRLHYSPEDGSVVGRELLPEADLEEYRSYREYSRRCSVPFLEYEDAASY
ncbi:DUF6879 family protein [Amycolatopsis sp. NPDC058986]